MEINQSIQDERGRIPLIASKAAIIRLYLGGSTPIEKVDGNLMLHYSSGEITSLSSLGAINTSTDMSPPSSHERERLESSLNFLIPPASFRVDLDQISFQPSLSVPGNSVECTNCQNIASLKIGASPTLKVRLVGIQHYIGKKVYEPSELDYALLESWLRRAYPTGKIYTTRKTLAYDGLRRCYLIKEALRDLKQQELKNGTIADLATHYYALVPNLQYADGNIDEMRGCSDTPPTVNFMAVGAGPSGKSMRAWDTDGTIADWYGGHELAHTLGRSHAQQRKECSGPLTDPDPGYPNPTGYLSTTDAQFVALDVGDPDAGIPVSTMPVDKWSDVMTYCDLLWVSKYTYEGILARLRAEQETLSSPVANAFIDSAIRVQAGAPPPSITEPTDAGVNAPADAGVNAPADAGVNAPADAGVNAPADAPEKPWQADESKAEQFIRRGDLLLVSAIVNSAGSKTQSMFVRRTTYAVLPTVNPSPRFSLKVIGSDGDAKPFPLYEIPSGEGEAVSLLGVASFEPQIAAIEIINGDKSIHKMRTDKNIPTIYGIGLPNSFGVDPEGGSVTWKGADADDSDLSYTVRISYDGGKTWDIAAIRLHTPRIKVDSAKVTDPKLVLIEVEASDGFHSTTTQFNAAH
ncbi:MAG: hypothetical protein ACJ8AT_31540 [Hyalangium sp.]|uniref:hypothetical protein n=1 Tax=Hyalangium sp. TaxID=2028555 RepID=UPI00389AE238